MDPVFELAIDVPPPGSRHLLRDLHRQLRAAILDGRLKPGLRLPASRVLAASYGMSRNTAVALYDLLLGEGYLVARPGAGTYVADVVAPRRGEVPTPMAPTWRELPKLASPAGHHAYAFDFRLGLPDQSPFPFDIWQRLSGRALRSLSKAPAAYADAQGLPALRQAIAGHVSFARAVSCRADDVVVTNGAQQAFDLLARVLVTPGKTVVAVEDPGYPPMRAAFAAAGAHIVGVPVDAEGLRVDRLPKRAHIVCVTPSHQFPLGSAMSATRRVALLAYARKHEAVIIEDDYDAEFRYGGRPLDALQTLAVGESVFYVGTFSKSLFPALRIGFVVAPAWARDALVAVRELTDWHSPVLAQATLAMFIADGHLARHVRRMRGIYAERRGVLLEALGKHLGEQCSPVPSIAGLHLSVLLAPSLSADVVVERAMAAGIGLESFSRYAVDSRAAEGLAFGYGTIRAERIDEAIARLAGVIQRL
ncbi:MAG TPA: PLP-dependent aminotransferase family protein [Luteibacter sp.]|jgi:GntR family transcriptional regulator/MocR family aminotransferase|nr:PLP-dependent aminotransferase family protein [Luteibacter sp.]